jgi:DNA repair exonuclease SbcCD ATPase subunit
MKWASEMGISLKEVAAASKATSGSMIIDAEEFTKTAKELAEKYVENEKSKLDKSLSDYRDTHQDKLDLMREEYTKSIENIDDILDEQLDAYDEQLDALDEQLKAIDQAQKSANDAQTKDDLESQISTEYDLKRKGELNKELDDLIVESGNAAWQKQRQTDLEALVASEKDADLKAAYEQELANYIVDLDLATQKAVLESEKDTIEKEREAAEEKASEDKERLKKAYDYKVELENQAYKDFENDIEKRKATLEAELVVTLARYDADLAAFIKNNSSKLDDTMNFVNQMNAELAKLKDRTVTVTVVTKNVTESSSGSSSESSGANPGLYTGGLGDLIGGMATGGKINARPGGTLFRGGEAGENEYVLPESKLDRLISSLLGFTSSSIQAILPAGAGGSVNNSRSINYNVNAHYSRPQEPQSLRLDLEAIAMMARS